MGLFSKIKQALTKTKEKISFGLHKLFTGGVFKDNFYDELEEILITADVGVETTEIILNKLKEVVDEKHIKDTETCYYELKNILKEILNKNIPKEYTYPLVLMITGVNGVGKTTTIGKLADKFRKLNKSVTVVAADTFRAAASEQLTLWAQKADVRIIKHEEGSDPGAVVYDAIVSAKAKNTDVLIIDTAGRLHNKKYLMDELQKINKIVNRDYSEALFLKYIVVDAITGQNAITQIASFNEFVSLDGIILTKLDGTAKGGVIFAIPEILDLPIVYVGIGEKIEDLHKFNADEFVDELFSKE